METIDEESLKEQLKEEMEKYEDEGYFKRLGKMFSGLGRPRDSREYKEAVLELQRQIAPLVAILLPVIGAVILFVVTAVSTTDEKAVQIEIAKPEEVEELKEPEDPPETQPPPEDMEVVDVKMDMPSMTPFEASEVAPPTSEPQSVKVATVDAVLNIKSPVTMKSVAGTARNAGVRGVYTKGGADYGDPTTERAVMKALRWLKLRQNYDGSWANQHKPAATGLAILTFLAHGETPGSAEFGNTVQRGLEYLMSSVHEKDGKSFFAGSDGNEYSYLIATYALCEAYGMTKNPNVQSVAEKTLSRIIKGQSPTGGWDYKINPNSTRDDLSFAGWALQAVKAGKMAGIHVSGMDECIKKAIKCLQTRSFYKDHFTYCANARYHPGLTATGCLAMQLLGHSDKQEVRKSLDYMRNWKPTFNSDEMGMGKDCATPQYYCYYATQCKYQAGMAKNAKEDNKKSWKQWNAAMKALYPGSIIDDKNKDGSPVTIPDANGKQQPVGHWGNKDKYSVRPFMDTCLVALQLMVYYRYLPTTSLKATEVEADVEALSKDKSGEIGVTIDL